MGDSNAEWGELASFDQELAEMWDGYERLPDPGTDPVLDAFCERKNISIASLLRLGARKAETNVLTFAFPGGIKFRDMVADARWSYEGSEWRGMKIVRAGAKASDAVIICEGETDGAKLTELYPEADVAIMPGGAMYFPATFAAQVGPYERVLVGLDNDEAGAKGSRRILDVLPGAKRFAPDAKDWCLVEDAPVLPDASSFVQSDILITARDLIALEPPDIISWHEQGITPVAGLIVIHGALKSFKSYIAFDLFSSLAQRQDWACFEPTEEVVKVAVVQYEIPWAYYRQRVLQLRSYAREPRLFDDNYLTYDPMRRPNIRVGDSRQEATMIEQLQEAGVQVVLFDPIRRLAGVIDFDKEKEVRPVLAFFEKMQDAGLTVVATHHDNKVYARYGGGDPLGMTGSGAWGGDPDTIISVALPRGEDPKTSTIRNLYFTLRNAPPIHGRGFKMNEDSSISYQTTIWNPESEEDDETGQPAI